LRAGKIKSFTWYAQPFKNYAKDFLSLLVHLPSLENIQFKLLGAKALIKLTNVLVSHPEGEGDVINLKTNFFPSQIQNFYSVFWNVKKKAF
jgi:hypothetical protein